MIDDLVFLNSLNRSEVSSHDYKRLIQRPRKNLINFVQLTPISNPNTLAPSLISPPSKSPTKNSQTNTNCTSHQAPKRRRDYKMSFRLSETPINRLRRNSSRFVAVLQETLDVSRNSKRRSRPSRPTRRNSQPRSILFVHNSPKLRKLRKHLTNSQDGYKRSKRKYGSRRKRSRKRDRRNRSWNKDWVKSNRNLKMLTRMHAEMPMSEFFFFSLCLE